MDREVLLTVVIPTYDRSKLLERSINSVVSTYKGIIDFEIIVVSNGEKKVDKNIEKNFFDFKNILFFHCNKAHANAARNYGLKYAKGKYIRFVDDDDYIISNGSIQQINCLENKNLDCVTGQISIYDENNCFYGLCSAPQNNEDFIISAMKVNGMTLPLASIYRTSLLTENKIFWDENVPKAQDYIFQLEICSKTEVKWEYIQNIVGVWYQHSGERVSNGLFQKRQYFYWIPEKLLMLRYTLQTSNRLSKVRDEFIYKSFWNFFENNYFVDKSSTKRSIKIINKIFKKQYDNGMSDRFTAKRIFFLSNIINRFPIVYIYIISFVKRIYLSIVLMKRKSIVRKI